MSIEGGGVGGGRQPPASRARAGRRPACSASRRGAPSCRGRRRRPAWRRQRRMSWLQLANHCGARRRAAAAAAVAWKGELRKGAGAVGVAGFLSFFRDDGRWDGRTRPRTQARTQRGPSGDAQPAWRAAFAFAMLARPTKTARISKKKRARGKKKKKPLTNHRYHPHLLQADPPTPSPRLSPHHPPLARPPGHHGHDEPVHGL